MASLRTIAQGILPEARDGIAWIAFYREGRGWGAECFWPDFDQENGSYRLEEDDLARIRTILATDENAIFVNGYDSNLGPLDDMTRDSLASALRWQYENQYNRLVDVWLEPAAQEQEEPVPAGGEKEQQKERRQEHGRRLDTQSGTLSARHHLLGLCSRGPSAREGPGLRMEYQRRAGGGLGCRPP